MKKEKVNLVALVGKQMRTGNRLNAIEKQMPSKGDGEDKKSLRNLGNLKAELDKIDKKDDIKRNILEGKIKKFITENTLINQPYIKDGSLTLKKILKNNKIIDYTRYQLGEGIEKKSDDFAEEVYSQIK